ncbi:MAG: hypothetical protein ACKVH8_10855 [Pirellulales bacterium]
MLSIERIAQSILLLTLACFLGCGGEPSLPSITGKVTFDGQPIEVGSIMFEPVDGKGTTEGGTIENGTYTVSVTSGSKKVRITSPKVVGQRKMYDTPDSEMIDITKELLPVHYNKKSNLTVTITEEDLEKNFDLTSK